MTHPSHQRINVDLTRALTQTSWRFYALVALPAALVLGGLVSWVSQMFFGFGISGIRWPVFWGFYVTNFVFWIGISHAGTLISAILRLVNAGWRRPVTRCAEVITVFALMIGAMFPILDLRRSPEIEIFLPDVRIQASRKFL
jgi:Ni/Fe-hydrogenase subunit HybB-like protein